MNGKKSIIASNSDVVEKRKQASDFSKDAVVLDQTNAQIVQNVRLIWLDNNIDEKIENCQDIITQLRSIVNAVDTFTNADHCIDFLTDVHNEKALMIISGALCRITIPLIHDVPQLHTIVIFSEDETRHEQWAKKWFKIKGVFSQILQACRALKEAAQQCEQNATSVSFVNTSGDVSKKNLDELDSSFMYTQILKEILLTIQFEQKHIKEFIDYCRVVLTDNRDQLNYVDKFEREYHDRTPIWWYTREYLLYSMLNRSLRLMDVNIAINMGFFISDLHRHIEQLHNEQFGAHHSGKSFIVYRGQGMSKADFDQMMKTKGGLMSFNNFLSTSKDRGVSLIFAESNQSNPDFVGILFVITIDPSKSTTPFASINGVSHFTEEDEVLFSMNTVFRICDVKPMDENKRLFEVDLAVTSDNDKDLCVLTELMREDTFPRASGWYRLGKLLMKIGHFEKAQRVYEIILEQTTDEIQRGPIYHQIGWVKDYQGEYKDAIIFYEKSLEIQHQSFPPNYPSLAASYNNIGMVYYNMTEYSKALSFYEKALEIRQKILPSNNSSLADSYNNIGNVYSKMGANSKALFFNEKALEIWRQSLPPNHPDLAASYSNIGNVHSEMGEHSKALLFLEKALEIRRQSLPPNHPDLATSYGNIGSMHAEMGQHVKALPYYEKALEIGQKLLPPNHPDLEGFYSNIGNVHSEIGEHSKALSSYEKVLEIRQKVLPSNHPDLATSYSNIGNVYSEMGEHSKALSYYEKALEIRQKVLPSNHRHLATSYGNIGNVHLEMGEYSKALSYYEKALEIRQKVLPSNHPDLATSYSNIGNVYSEMGEHSKALSYYEKALEIRQKVLPSNHRHLATSYGNIGNVHLKMAEYSKALSYYEKALEIQQKVLPSNHPDLATSYRNIGFVYDMTGEHSKALSSYEKALEICQKMRPSNHHVLATSYNSIGVVHRNMGNYSEARSFYERAVNIGQRSLPTNHPHLQVYRQNLASIKMN